MATIVTYNQIEIHNALMKRFDQDVQYDQSNTDAIYSRFTFVIDGIIHGRSAQAALGGQEPTGNSSPMWTGQQGTSAAALPPVGQMYPQIARALWQPRCKLSITMGGVPIFACNAPGTGTPGDDLNNGPKPKRVELTHITSDNVIGPTFHVTFEIECAISACPGLSQSLQGVPPILSNRWAVSETLDDEFFTTRTVRGQIIAANAGVQLDRFRWLMVPTLEKGFRRDRLDYNISADALKVDYILVDKQIHTAAPWPAVKINVRHTEQTGDGASFESECYVTLHGHPGADKLALINLAARIIENRLGKMATLADVANATPVSYGIIDNIGERNVIDMWLKIRHTLGYTANNNITARSYLATPVGQIGTPLAMDDSRTSVPKCWDYTKQYDPITSPVTSPWGYNTTQTPCQIYGEKWRASFITNYLLYCFLQDPCDNSHWVFKTLLSPIPSSQPPPVNPYGTTGNSDSAYQGGDQPSPKPPPTPPIPSAGNPTTVTSSANIPPMSLQDQPPSIADPKKPLFTFVAAETILSVSTNRVQLPIGLNPSKYKPSNAATATPPFGNTAVLATLGLPTATLMFHIEAECMGKYPSIPQPVPVWATSDGIQGALLSAVIEPMPPVLNATQSAHIFHVTCRYLYGLSRPPQANEKIPIGVLPTGTDTPQETALALGTLYYDPNQQVLGIPNGASSVPAPTPNKNWSINPVSGSGATSTATTNW